jgi:hypothetical protein
MPAPQFGDESSLSARIRAVTRFKGLLCSVLIDIKRFSGSSVSVTIGYALDDQGVGVRVSVGSRIFTFPYRPNCLLSNGYRGLFPQG